MSEEYRINIMDDRPAAPQEQQQAPFAPAGITERFVALLIDWGIIFIPYQLLLSVAVRYVHPDLSQLYWMLAGVNIPFILYETVFTSGGRMTLGKMLVGVRVVDKDTGEPLELWRAFVRAIGYYISAAILMCGFLLAFLDDRHRALQDYLAGSVVVQARQKSGTERAVLSLAGAVLMIAFIGYFYSQFFGAGSLAQQRLISRAQEHVEKIGYLQEVHRLKYGYYTNDLLRLSLLSGDPVQFQRDTQEVLHRKGFKLGVAGGTYKISAHAKDKKRTAVYFPSL